MRASGGSSNKERVEVDRKGRQDRRTGQGPRTRSLLWLHLSNTSWQPILLMVMPWSRIVDLRLVTTFILFVFRNAQKYFFRAESYLKPYDHSCFYHILHHKSLQSKLLIFDRSSHRLAAWLAAPYIVLVAMSWGCDGMSSRQYADTPRKKCVLNPCFSRIGHKSHSCEKMRISIFDKNAK